MYVEYAKVNCAYATASLLTSAVVMGSVLGLADHYNDESQLASAPRAVVAQR